MIERNPGETASPFSRLVWEGDQARLGNLSFLIEEHGSPIPEPPELPGPSFVLYKTRHIIDIYRAFWASVPEFWPQRIFEVGVWRAGSAVFFAELFRPDKLVAIDLERRSDLGPATIRQLERWLSTDGRSDRVKFYWEIDQADKYQVLSIVRQEFAAPLDLVIDDASHLYLPSKRAFEALFPHIRPGGWYAIEDWSWHLNRAFQVASHPWATETPLMRLVEQLITVAGTNPAVIPAIRVAGQIAFVQRGTASLAEDFTIEGILEPRLYGRFGIYSRRLWWATRRLWKMRG